MSTIPDDDPLPQPDLAFVGTLSRPVSVCWNVLDHITAWREWRALAECVRWLAIRYDLGPKTIPACWYRHGALVEELSALRTGWLAALAPDAPGGTLLDWHAMFWGTRDRLQQRVRLAACISEHRDD